MNKHRIGILGAGQLGAYLCEAAHQLGLEAYVLADSIDAPAVQLADGCVFGDCNNVAAISRLSRAVDVLTFEREDIGRQALDELERPRSEDAVLIAPRPHVIRLLQNKAEQKRWLVDKGYPTAEFLDCDQHSREEAAMRLGLPLIQKAKRGGFDGRGVQIIDQSNLNDFWAEGSIAESCVPFEREISVLLARDSNGNLAFYPLIEAVSKPSEHLLDYAMAPAQIEEAQRLEALRLAADVVTELQGVGVFAIEMFVLANGQVLINEISPRVHNTGHLTIEANDTSQFEQHLRAVCGLGLASTRQEGAALCKNLLYPSDASEDFKYPFACRELQSGVWLHWYGKRHGKSLRKMGHLSCTGDTLDEALANLAKYDVWSSLDRNLAA